MAFADYADLRLAVGEAVNNRSLSDVMDRLTRLAEIKLSRVVRAQDGIKRAVLTFVAGAAPLPADFEEVVAVFSGPSSKLAAGSISSATIAANRTFYAIEGGNMLFGNFAGDLDLVYYAALPTITSAPTASNWLLRRYPDAYLYAVACEAAKHLRDPEQVAAYDALLARAVGSMKAAADAQMWSAAVVQPQMVMP